MQIYSTSTKDTYGYSVIYSTTIERRLYIEFDKYDAIIFVGHSVALESFVNYQKEFMPENKITELSYGQFVVLNRKR